MRSKKLSEDYEPAVPQKKTKKQKKHELVNN